MTEYAALVAVVGLVIVAAVAVAGPRLSRDYARTTSLVSGPAP
jgi:hypothetical protein